MGFYTSLTLIYREYLLALFVKNIWLNKKFEI